MANSIDKEKDKTTNTFYVNPKTDEGYDEKGVTYPEGSYSDGIEVPDKLVTTNGDINYRLLDAANIDWDRAQIPWAKYVTEWSDKYFDKTADYKYHKPADESWTSGQITESEEVVDILNYLIYRTVVHDSYIKQTDEKGKSDANLRIVNNRTDWYEDYVPSYIPSSDTSEMEFTEKLDDATITFVDASGKGTTSPSYNKDYVSFSQKNCGNSSINDVQGISMKGSSAYINLSINADKAPLGLNEFHVFYTCKSSNVRHKEVDRLLKLTFTSDDIDYAIYGVWGTNTDTIHEFIFDLTNYDNVTDIRLTYGPDFDSTIVINKVEFYIGETKTIVNPDSKSGDNDDNTNMASDNRYTVKGEPYVYLYPYLVANTWSNPDDTTSDVIPLLNHEGLQEEGIVLSDIGYAIQRDLIFTPTNIWNKIKEGGENFDIYQVETESDSHKITFNSTNSVILDGHVQRVVDKSVATADDGEVLEYLYKLPVYAKRCSVKETYDYTSKDILQYLFTNNVVGINNAHYSEITYRSTHPQIDVDKASVTMSVTIEASDTYASDTFSRIVHVYKGNNQLFDLSLADKSVVSSTEDVVDSHNVEHTRNVYLTTIPVRNEDEGDTYKYTIHYEAEFDEEYDAEHTGSTEAVMQQSHMYPYFILKKDTDSSSTLLKKWQANITNINNYAKVQAGTTETLVLFEDEELGSIQYENGNYVYYAPVSASITENLHAKLYMLMYYPIADVTTNRLLKPLWSELELTLEPIKENSIVFSSKCTHKEGTDYAIYECNSTAGSVAVSSLVTTALDEAGATLLPIEVELLGYATDDYSARKDYNYADPTKSCELIEREFGWSILTEYIGDYTIKKDSSSNPIITTGTSVPERNMLTFETSPQSTKIPEIVLSDCVSCSDGAFTISASTAEYPKENGLLITESDLLHSVDADNDYFYVAFKVTCPKDYTGTTSSMREECSGTLFIKVKRVTPSVTLQLINSSLTVTNTVDLTDELTSLSKIEFDKFDGKYQWCLSRICETVKDNEGNIIKVLHDPDTEGKYSLLVEDIDFPDSDSICVNKMRTVTPEEIGSPYYVRCNYSGSTARIGTAVVFGNTSLYTYTKTSEVKLSVNKIATNDIKFINFNNGVYSLLGDVAKVIKHDANAYLFIASDFYGDNDKSTEIDLDDILKGDLKDTFGTNYTLSIENSTYEYNKDTGMFTISFDNVTGTSTYVEVPVTLTVGYNSYCNQCNTTGYYSYTL